jgi:Gram-negative bacterial TonB protein C-terminal
MRWMMAMVLAISLPGLGHYCEAQGSAPSGGDFASAPAKDVPAAGKVPQGVILVKGAWPSASDSTTPVPEGGSVDSEVFRDPYFGMTYPLPTGWDEKYKGPPPSDSGRYVLTQLRPPETSHGSIQGQILVTADDMFFTPMPVSNALELTAYEKDNLQSDYRLELPPTQTKIAGRPFTFYAYWSPIAELHWYVLGTEIRCHAIEFVMTSRDTKLLQSLVIDLNRMTLPEEASPSGGTGGGQFPVCIKDYANDTNVLSRVDPIFTEHKFNPVPVRIIIDRTGKVKHIHFLRAFPDQEKAVTQALAQWKFKPYVKNQQALEVETGLMFGQGMRRATQNAATAVE